MPLNRAHKEEQTIHWAPYGHSVSCDFWSCSVETLPGERTAGESDEWKALEQGIWSRKSNRQLH